MRFVHNVILCKQRRLRMRGPHFDAGVKLSQQLRFIISSRKTSVEMLRLSGGCLRHGIKDILQKVTPVR